MHGTQQEGRPTDPVGKRRAVQRDALSGQDLGLAVERQVIGVFGDQNLGDGRVGRQPALDQPGRRWRLDYDVLAGPAGVAGPPDHQDPDLRRHDVEALGDVLADPVQVARAARAGPALDVDQALDPGQVRRQGAPVRPALRDPGGLRGRCILGCGEAIRLDLLGLLEPEEKLILRQGLGATAEPVTLQLPDDLAQALALGTFRRQHRLQQAGIVRKRLHRCAHDSD